MKFSSRQALEACDVLFLALPHGESQKMIDHYAGIAPKIVDLSADFRLRSHDLYKKFYGEAHKAPAWLDKFVYGLPELHREEMRSANYISGVGLQCYGCQHGFERAHPQRLSGYLSPGHR